MDEFQLQLSRTVKVVRLILGLMALGLIYDYRSPLIWGVMLGTGVSLINSIMLGNRMKKMVELPIFQAIFFMRQGYAIRLIFILFALYMGLKLPQFDLYAVAAGLFVAQAVSIIDLIFRLIRGEASANAAESDIPK